MKLPASEAARVVPALLEQGLLREREVAQYLSLSERQVRTLRAAGMLPHARIGRAVRYRPEDIRRYVADNIQGGAR